MWHDRREREPVGNYGYDGGGRRRSRSRSPPRTDRDRPWVKGEALSDASSCVIVRDLPPTVTEQQVEAAVLAYYPTSIRLVKSQSGCMAYVEFHSSEYTAALTAAYGGSTGVHGQPQLFIDGRPVMIELTMDQPRDRDGPSRRRDRSRERSRDRSRDRGRYRSRSRSRDRQRRDRSRSWERDGRQRERERERDWLCITCHKINYGRRSTCCRCDDPKPPEAILLEDIGPTGGLQPDETDRPGAVLVLKGVPIYSNEASVAEAVAAIAGHSAIKECGLLRDRKTNASKGLAYVEMQSSDDAAWVLAHSMSLMVDGRTVRMAFARRDSWKGVLGAPPKPAGNYGPPPLQHGEPPPVPLVAAPEWPPCFEEAPGAFVLDEATGYYWEGYSGFYYDATSRLYYSMNRKTYFRYAAGVDPPFIRWDPPPPPDEASELGDEDTTRSLSITDSGERKAVSLTLKPGKKLSGVVKKVTEAVARPAGWTAEAAEDDMMEENDNGHAAPPATTSTSHRDARLLSAPPTAAAAAADSAAKASTSAVHVPLLTNDALLPLASPQGVAAPSLDANGEPVCLLCRRSFDSVEKLRKHEAVSKLHAENLAKARAEGSSGPLQSSVAASSSTEQMYRDRAAQRREFYGQDDKPRLSIREEERRRKEALQREQDRRDGRVSTNSNTSSSRKGRSPPRRAIPHARPPPSASEDKPLGDDNIGAQMLKNLGWKQGEGLGRDGSGIRDPIKAAGAQKDRDKGGLGAKGREEDYSHVINEGNDWRENAKAVARARFEKLVDEGHKDWTSGR